MTASTALLEAIKSYWGAPDAQDQTPLLVDGVRVGQMQVAPFNPDCVRIAAFEVEDRYRGRCIGTRLLYELGDMADATGCAKNASLLAP